MSSNQKVNISGGVSVSSLLGILFIGLKLTGFISWSWVWVLSPFWIPFGFIIFFLLLALIISLVGAILK